MLKDTINASKNRLQNVKATCKGAPAWNQHANRSISMNSAQNIRPQHEALGNNYRVCGVYSPELRFIVLGWILIRYIEIGLLTVTCWVQDAKEGCGSNDDKLRTNWEQSENKRHFWKAFQTLFSLVSRRKKKKKLRSRMQLVVGQQCLWVPCFSQITKRPSHSGSFCRYLPCFPSWNPI